MLVDLTIKGFLAETAGSAPVPGGGSISALNGAIATALTEMVANLTIGKKKYADVEGQMRTIATEAAIIRESRAQPGDPGCDETGGYGPDGSGRRDCLGDGDYYICGA